MKVTRRWLREWIDVPWSTRELGTRLTMAGFELESLTNAAPEFSGVIVAEIQSAAPHPQAEKLQVCRVTAGGTDSWQVVCGAGNARPGLRTALAQIGAHLPGDKVVRSVSLRGVESEGMLCSAKELGLGDVADGILELPPDTPLGRPLRAVLELEDEVLELNVTPNRGDAMSVLGVAREVAALARVPLIEHATRALAASSEARIEVTLAWAGACPKLAARVVRGLENHGPSPLWLRERLRRVGVRAISPVVDVTNYVLLELGQPLHAYDRARLEGGLCARAARAGERLMLLDGKEITLEEDTLVIADELGAVGLAGVMGGARTAVSEATTEIVLEAAHFAPRALAGRARRYGLQTDASQRFERGVDPHGTDRALERATALLLEITGGEAGPIHTRVAPDELPQRRPIRLRRTRISRLLGVAPSDEDTEVRLEALGMQVRAVEEGWQVTPPSYRFDVAIEADLIEEIARIGGYDSIPESDAGMPQRMAAHSDSAVPEYAVLAALTARDYREAITFAFVDPALQSRLFPGVHAVALVNPIASDLSVLRVSLWPGLLRAALENLRRQQDRVRLFEHGVRFLADGEQTTEIDTLAGLAVGTRSAEQWGLPRAPVDFFDVKGDLESLLMATGRFSSFTFESASLACLHPGRSARILLNLQMVGWIGEIHPQLVTELGLGAPLVLFEVDYAALASATPPVYETVSRFPQVRRDVALVVDEEVPLSALRDRVTFVASSLLREFRVFDIYQGKGIEKGRKSVALGLIFQDKTRTLTDEETDRVVAEIVADLNASCNARLRE